MKIIDLGEEHEDLFCKCLEDWSDEMKDAGDHRARWLQNMKSEGLIAKLALDDRGIVGGMIQAVPADYAPIQAEDMHFITCTWVHGYKQGRGNFQKKGMGKALLKTAEEEARAIGSKAIAAWGLAFPIWMKASWYKKHGYKKVDNRQGAVLLWKPLTEDAVPPEWIRPKKTPQAEPGKVVVTAFKNGWCSAQNINFQRARRASEELGDRVEFREIDTFRRDTFLEWGIMDSVYVDGKVITTGPPLSYEKIKKKINKRLKMLG